MDVAGQRLSEQEGPIGILAGGRSLAKKYSLTEDTTIISSVFI